MAGIIAKSAFSKTAHCFCCTLFRVRSCTAQAVFVSCGRRTRRGGGGDATGEALPQAMSRRHCRCCRQAMRRSQAFVVARKRNPVSDYLEFTHFSGSSASREQNETWQLTVLHLRNAQYKRTNRKRLDCATLRLGDPFVPFDPFALTIPGKPLAIWCPQSPKSKAHEKNVANVEMLPIPMLPIPNGWALRATTNHGACRAAPPLEWRVAVLT